ncbi:hypothetical protein BJ508DRAFT_367784 [Ascobolus immersus RN42]|uniref:GTP-binding protein n=1 Tax=Ascobolus immersus RN42 TaxID=1160509 RepID=A0A3N4H9S8_ASCIM|nr:hypothetical protein BJ508DRAFT_367784 [Ascobolus immersus RN42]
MSERKGRKKKVLLMGKSGSGKSSMRSIVFSNYVARDTRRLGATIDIEHSHVRFLGNLTLNLWDCGGQDAFMEHYLQQQRDHIFKNVAVLIYVFDIESREFGKDALVYSQCIEALRDNSPGARVFVLVHKMDLVQGEVRERVFGERRGVLEERGGGMDVRFFGTSIWDETLYKAWASIVHTLIPNLPTLTAHLRTFTHLCEAEEVILFERTTFLVISHIFAGTTPNPHPDRFEKISNIVKQFKQSCSKMASFTAFTLRAANFSAFIDVLTPNTYILVVMPAGVAETEAVVANIGVARRFFGELEGMERRERGGGGDSEPDR